MVISVVYYSPVHVVLVSLLVDQLSGLFLFFLVDQKKLSSLRDRTKKFWSVSEFFFGQSLSFFVHPLIERLTKKNS